MAIFSPGIQFGRHLSDYSPALRCSSKRGESERNPNMTCPPPRLPLFGERREGERGEPNLSPFSPAVIHFSPNPLVTFGTDCSGLDTGLARFRGNFAVTTCSEETPLMLLSRKLYSLRPCVEEYRDRCCIACICFKIPPLPCERACLFKYG